MIKAYVKKNHTFFGSGPFGPCPFCAAGLLLLLFRIRDVLFREASIEESQQQFPLSSTSGLEENGFMAKPVLGEIGEIDTFENCFFVFNIIFWKNKLFKDKKLLIY
jgi:hypothetical protein